MKLMKPMKLMQLAKATAVASLLSFAAMGSALAAYPEKPIRLIVPQPAGGFNDTVARVLSRKLGEAWGQPIVVENLPGAGSQVGTAAAARAPADGYTLLVVSFAFCTNPSLRKSLPYDTVKAFRPVILLGQTPNLLVVNPASPYKSVQEVIRAAKASPGKLTYASSGPGSSPHLSMELFKSMAGVDLTHVPYKGGAPMATDLMGGQVDIMFDNTPNLMPYVKSGKMRALGVTSAQRTELAHNVPTIAESGVPGYEMTAWYGVVAPSGTPDAIVQKLNAEIGKILAQPDVKTVFAAQNVAPNGGMPQVFADFLTKESAKWAKVIKQAGITPD